MASFIDALDANVARRELRDALLETAPALGRDPAAIPHSFDTRPLLAFAEGLLAERAVEDRGDLLLGLIARTGVTAALSGDDERAIPLLERGYRAADTNQKRAQFLYHKGYHSEHRRGDSHRARRTLEEAHALSERSRRLRGEILLALGTIEMNVGNLDSSERAINAALDLHLRDLEPHALLRLSTVRTSAGEFDEAVRLNRRSHDLFRRQRDGKGMKAASSNLALLQIERGELEEARTTLDAVIAEGLRTLDIPRLGRDYNNRAVLLSSLGDAAGARDAILDAIRFHEASERRQLLIGNYQNLGGYLVRLDEADAGLAAFEHAGALARELGLASREFQVLAFLLLSASEERLAFPALPAIVTRCRELMEEAPEQLPRKSLVNFGLAMQAMAEAPSALPRASADVSHTSFATDAGRTRLRALTPRPEAVDFDSQLDAKLGSGLPGREVPGTTDLRRFLMQFIGDFFKSGNYTREFAITQERAKRHLRWMCTEGVIERKGSRKASRYSLAFHR